MTVALKISNLSKMYRLGTVGTGTLSHDLNRWWAMLRGKEDPTLKIGQINDRTKTSAGSSSSTENTQSSGPDYVWALRDINLDVEQGEILGIIGRNGAGKSTLLKLLSRVTAPTTGSIKARGRIASLLEVGTGFHPELTGRENVYLNGAIMGMTREEVEKRLDEIVEFSGCAKYIDTPVKRYSSGMMVRLGFAVAAHLECEILIVDEVLAVGDVEFQKKCIGKMQDVGAAGKTVLLVSHNMNTIASLAQRSALMSHGKLVTVGETPEMIERYRIGCVGQTAAIETAEFINPEKAKTNRLARAKVVTSENDGKHHWGEPCEFRFEFEIGEPRRQMCFSFQIVNSSDLPVCHIWAFDQNPLRESAGTHVMTAKVPSLKLFQGEYKIRTFLTDRSGNEMLDRHDGICSFEVAMGDMSRSNYPWQKGDCVYLEEFEWSM